MVDVLPVSFPIPSESSIASYNYTDVEEGTGIVILYGARVQTKTVTSYILTRDTIYSNAIETTNVTPGAAINFDLSEFNLPKIIKGTALISLSASLTGGSYVDFTITFQKVSGGSASTLVSTTLERLSALARLTGSAVIPQTHFKKGDNLRVVVNGAMDSGSYFLAHDPANRNGVRYTSDIPSQMQIAIPFKLDL
jgi:hypothetical protein